MTHLSTYIGLFTGLTIAGMGLYFFFHPLQSSSTPWLMQGLPVFMIGYGIVRLGFSLYQVIRLFRRKTTIPSLSVGALLGLAELLESCSQKPEANMRVRMDYAGDCATCPISRMDSILRVFFREGITTVVYDSANHQVVLDMDSNLVKLDSLQHVLLAYGYEVNEEFPLDPILSPCCQSSSLHSPSSSPESPFFAMPHEEVHEGMSLLEKELESAIAPEIGGGTLPEEPDIGGLEDELSNIEEELNIGDELDTSEIGLEELEMEEELGLEEGEGSPKKKGTSEKKK
ncbi:MAG: hypothetical protein RMJ66_04260 [Bacteroidia bacterium]|nr:hypothetical protein [Bacteroidia bacterium]MDW8134261.1 hypothetical protein [Bacteroidia bacterium]